MFSNFPKVLHKIGMKSMLQHIIDTIVSLGIERIYIVCNNQNKEIIQKEIRKKVNIFIRWIDQGEEGIGTGYAVYRVIQILCDGQDVLVINGDVPLISSKTLKQLYLIKKKCDLGLLVGKLVNAYGYGKIVRNKKGNVISIIENDYRTNNKKKRFKEIYAGVLIAERKNLKSWLDKLMMTYNKKYECYLTNIIRVAYNEGCIINTILPLKFFEVLGVNNKLDLAKLNYIYRKNEIRNLLLSGVTISDPNRFDLRGKLLCGKDVYIDVNVIIEGDVFLGNDVHIGAGCILKNSIIKDNVVIYPYSIVENSEINSQSYVGPFSRLRPGTKLDKNNCIGNFVELKNSKIGEASKIKHLSYLGDVRIGKRVNIGAGTIFCNYDGVKKHKTVVNDDVIIGANSQIIAPVTIKKGAVVGAGTTITHDVEENQTVISRVKQFSILKNKI